MQALLHIQLDACLIHHFSALESECTQPKQTALGGNEPVALYAPKAFMVSMGRSNVTWFHPGISFSGMPHTNGLTLVVAWKLEARNRRRMPLSSRTCTSKKKGLLPSYNNTDTG